MDNEELLGFFKALAEANRLKIVGLLAKQPYSVEQLAALLGTSPSTVSHHLAKLAEAGLVSATAESYYNMYHLETKALEAMTKRLLAQDGIPMAAKNVDLDAYDRKVLRNFTTADGRLKTIPLQRKKLEAILRYVLKDFEQGRRYSEKEVNQILGRYHEDTATLRRELVGYHMMEREGGGGVYWRAEEKSEAEDSE